MLNYNISNHLSILVKRKENKKQNYQEKGDEKIITQHAVRINSMKFFPFRIGRITKNPLGQFHVLLEP